MNLFREILLGIFNKIKSKIDYSSISEERLNKIDYIFREFKLIISTINNCEGTNNEKLMMLNIIDNLLFETSF